MKKSTLFCCLAGVLFAATGTMTANTTEEITTTGATRAIEAPVANNDDDQIYATAEQMPQFPGGDMEMMKFINKNLSFPVDCEPVHTGMVIIGFVVEKNGEITNVEIKKSLGRCMDTEAVRLVKTMPNWTPGKDKGKEVRVKFYVPIEFKSGS